MNKIGNDSENYSLDVYDLKKHVGEDFIAKFIKKNNLEELQSLIKDTVKTSREKLNRSVVISICNEKGGSGKSTVTIALGQLLANLGFKVCVLDTDNQRSSCNSLSSRISMINNLISQECELGVAEEQIISKKKNLDPIVSAIEVNPKHFNLSYIENIASQETQDIVLIDTAGRKDQAVGNFDIRKIGQCDVPHVSSAAASNYVIIPMNATGIDMMAAVDFYLPLLKFNQQIDITGERPFTTGIKILPSRVVQQPSSINELNKFKDETNFDFFETSIHASQKIASCISIDKLETLYTTNVASGVLNSFFSVTQEAFREINQALSK